MSKFIIAGREYRPESALKASLNIWRRVLTEQGVGLKTVIADISAISSPIDILEDPKLLKSFMVFFWVLRLAAGEEVTFEEVGEVALDDFRVVVGEEEPAEDPKAPADSEADASPAT